MVRGDVSQSLEPEKRDLRKEFAFIWNALPLRMPRLPDNVKSSAGKDIGNTNVAQNDIIS
jgi:hypothetical protein